VIANQVMWNSAHVMDMVNEAKNFGVITSAGKFDWPTLKEARDAYITRLNGIYERNLGNSGVKIIQGVSINDATGRNIVKKVPVVPSSGVAHLARASSLR